MKTKLITIAALALSLAFSQAEEKIKAPNGGRIIDAVEPHAEFFVTEGKKIEIRFLDDAGKVVAPAAQTATVTMGDRSAPTKLAFTKDGDKLVSDKTIPDGKELPVVLQIKTTPDAKNVTEKFNLNLAKCPTCEHSEYACTCEHGGGEKDHGHDHKEGDGHKH
jgi:hypothetical protein